MSNNEQVKEIISLMETAMSDRSIPRNVRRVIEEGKSRLQDEKEDISVAIATTIFELDEVANDINIPMHARSEIWNVVSELERFKEELK